MSNGRLALAGSAFLTELRSAAVKLAIAMGVIGASLPPATAISACPARIMAAASATASNPEGQAADSVVACAKAPIRSAITFAGPCGSDAAGVIGETRFGL